MKYYFKIVETKINDLVRLSPRIVFEKPNDLLCDLTYVGGDNGGYEGVLNIIKKLYSLQEGDVYCWGGHIIAIESNINSSNISDIELINNWCVSTKDIIDILEKWKEFLETNGFNLI
jgi:hypothetical protein